MRNVMITGITGYLGSAVLKMFQNNGDTIIPAPYDLRIPQQIPERINGVDILINCAGVQGPVCLAENAPLKQVQETINVNLVSPMALCMAVLSSMKEKEYGRIINISGGGAANPRLFHSAYAASKTALVRFSECVAEENRKKNITINCVAPGMMNSRLAGQIVDPNISDRNRYRAVELIFALTTESYKNVSGKLISAKWDMWTEFPGTNIPQEKYTLRRII